MGSGEIRARWMGGDGWADAGRAKLDDGAKDTGHF